MDSEVSFPGKVLVTTDFSNSSVAAFRYAVDQAQSNNAQLELFSVVEGLEIPLAMSDHLPSADEIENIRTVALAEADRKLQALLVQYFAKLPTTTTVVEHIGSPAELIVEHAKQGGHGLIIIATHGHGLLARAVLGSVAERVIRSAHCPVLVVPSRLNGQVQQSAQLPYRKIVVLTDFSDASQAAFTFAQTEARRTGAAISLVNVVEKPIPPELLEGSALVFFDKAEDVLKRYRAGIEKHLRELSKAFKGNDVCATVLDKIHSVPNTLTEYARTISADLIVMATKGSGNALTWIGGVAERVVRHASCPVLLIPSGAK